MQALKERRKSLSGSLRGHKVTTAGAHLLVLTAFRSVGLLDVLSSTTARASIARPCQDGISTASLHNLVRKAVQLCYALFSRGPLSELSQ